MIYSYEQALQSFVLGSWWVCEKDYYGGLRRDHEATAAALRDLRDNAVASITDPTPEWMSVFAGTFQDSETFRYESCVVTSGTGATYVFADPQARQFSLGEMIKIVLDNADTYAHKVITDRYARLMNPQTRY